MRKLIERSASEPSLTHNVHTHIVTYQSCGSTVTYRCYSEAAAEWDRQWEEERNGRIVEVKRVGQ